jgi:hypothetical protein
VTKRCDPLLQALLCIIQLTGLFLSRCCCACAAFDAVVTLLRSTEHGETRTTCLSALGCVTDEPTLSALFHWTLSSGEVRIQELPPLLSALADNTTSRVAAWRFFRDNFPALAGRFVGCAGALVATFVIAPLRTFADAGTADEAVAFFAAQTPSESGVSEDVAALVAGCTMAIAQAVEAIRARHECVDRAGSALAAALAAP